MNTTTHNPIAITDAGAYLADVCPFNSALIATDPIATPMEKSAMTKVETVSSAVSTFLTSGGNTMMSTAPIDQKKLIAQIAMNSRGMCIVALMTRHDADSGL